MEQCKQYVEVSTQCGLTAQKEEAAQYPSSAERPLTTNTVISYACPHSLIVIISLLAWDLSIAMKFFDHLVERQENFDGNLVR